MWSKFNFKSGVEKEKLLEVLSNMVDLIQIDIKIKTL